MPVLLRTTAVTGFCSAYISAASRYILRAMRMSPRCSEVSGLRGGLEDCAQTVADSSGTARRTIDQRGETISASRLLFKHIQEAAEDSLAFRGFGSLIRLVRRRCVGGHRARLPGLGR